MLRGYQAQAVEELRAAVRAHRSAVYVLPTGGGKTVVAAEVARRGEARGKRTLLLVHRRELVKQAVATLSEACPDVEVGVEAAGWPSWPSAPLQVGMVQSVARRAWDVRPDIVIVDEAHHARAATWEGVLGRWPRAARIGLTATPERRDGLGLGEHFAAMVVGPSIPALTAAGWLAPVRTYTVPVGLDLAGLRADRGGEYRPGEVDARVTATVVARAADAYERHAAGRQAVFFGATRRHSEAVVADLRRRGVRAEHVDGTDPTARRDRVMDEFRRRAVQVVGNVSLIDEGFDAPACDVVMVGAPTRSVTRWLQQTGRCMRPGAGKTATVLDLAGVAHLLGLPDEERGWSLDGGERADRRASASPVSSCPRCRRAHRGAACPECGAGRPGGRRVVERPVDLVEAPPRRVAALSARRRAAIAEAIRAPTDRAAAAALDRFAAESGYRPAWAARVWSEYVAPSRRGLRNIPRHGVVKRRDI